MAQPGSINDRVRTSFTEDTLDPGTSREKVIAIIDPSQLPLTVTGIFDTAFVCGPVAVTNVPAIAKVGASNLADRKFLTIANYSGVAILYGPATVANASDNGIRIPNGADRTIEVGPNINIYIVRQSGSGSVNVVVHEGS